MTDFFDKTKVAQLNGCLFLDQHIFWLHVSMEKTVPMNVVKGGSDLRYDVPNFLMGEGVIV